MPSGAPVAPADYPSDIEGAVLASVVLSDRNATLAEFEDYLRTVNNRDGRPYEEKTISNYVGPGKNLDVWMTASGLDGDFTVLDVATLNRYFREYYLAHGQGGTHTLQRNLIQLFNYLEHERGFASPYSGALNRYTPVKGRPKTLSADFIDELLEVTGGGRARDFETARDHAIIRILRSEGIRRTELLDMAMHTLPADVIRNPIFRLVPLKGARAAGEGRLVALAPVSARALALVPTRPPRPLPSQLRLGLARDPRPRPIRQHRYPQDADPPGRAGRLRGRDPAPVPPHCSRLVVVSRLAPESPVICGFRLRRAVSCFYGYGS